jgi:hypothetical protein
MFFREYQPSRPGYKQSLEKPVNDRSGILFDEKALETS